MTANLFRVAMVMFACSKGGSGPQPFITSDSSGGGGGSGGSGVPEAVPVAEAIQGALPANASLLDPPNPSNLGSMTMPRSVQISNVNVFISGREGPGSDSHGDGCRMS